MGLEMAGVVAATGETVTQWQPGDRVIGLLSGGGYAERVAVPATHLLPLPAERDFIWGAAICEVFLTAFVNLFREAGLCAGETALIHGGGQRRRYGRGATMPRSWCQGDCHSWHGRQGGVLPSTGRRVWGQLQGAGFCRDHPRPHRRRSDVILDIAGASYLARNVQLLKSGGRLVIIAVLTGAQAQIDLLELQKKRLRLIGSVLRSRSDEEKNCDHRGLQRALLAAANRRAHARCDRGCAAH